MKKTILLALLASASPLFGTVFTGSVTGDTYIRNDGTLQNSNGDGDTDNEFLVGDNAGSIRGLLAFNVAQIVNDVNTIGGGNFANLTINSASLELFERRGFARTINVTVNSYGFDFVANSATWNAPASGDTNPGGTIGSALASQNVTWNATSDSESAVITLNTSALGTSIQAAPSAGRVNFLLRSTNTGGNNFLSITSDRSSSTGRHAKLTIDYTVTPAGGPILALDPASPNPNFTFPFSQTTASPLTRTLRYRNDGTSGTITISDVVVSNTLGSAFSSGTISPALPASLSPGQTIDIPIIASSATSGSFTGSVFIDTDINAQDKTEPLSASFYQSGQTFGANASMVSGTASWDGASTWTTPGLLGINADGMARVRGDGDPVRPLVKSSHAQSATIPNNLPDWCLDFRFTPIAPSLFADYAGQAPDGSFADRTFQLVIQSTDTTPVTALNDTIDDNTLINIGYFPGGVISGGVAGFYQFNQGTWQLLDFNGDGSPLVLEGSTDVDTDADAQNGIGDGNLSSTSGDTVNVYRMTLTGSAFGTPSASYSIVLTGPGGLNKTVTGITGYHNQNPTSALPASFAFITSDTSSESNAGAGFCPSFWVDEIGYFAVARPAQRLLVFNSPSLLQSLNGSSPNHVITALNDGASAAVNLSASTSGTSTVTLQSPPSFPAAIAAGSQLNLTLGMNPALTSPPDTAAAGLLSFTSDDTTLLSGSFAYFATEVTDANLVGNADFESTTGSGVFPVGWTLTGTPSSIATFLPSGGGSNAARLSPSQGILQDVIPAGTSSLANFQADFAFQIGSETQAHRIRIEGNNGSDLVTLRLTTNPSATDSIDVFNSGTFINALTGLTIAPNTTCYLRVIGHDFGLAGRGYTVGFSTDGITYTTSADLTAFHASTNVGFETVTFECGATADSSLAIDNVVVTVPSADDFAAWMAGFTFESGADLTPSGDADGDGIANLVENVFGTAPNAPSTGLTGIASTAGSISFQHLLNPDLASDVSYTYEWSTDLTEWNAGGQANTGGVTVDITPSAPVSDIVTVSASVASGSATRLFVRLTATQVEP